MKKNLLLIHIFLIGLLLCFGLREGFSQSVPKKGGMITVGLNADVANVDPDISASIVDTYVLNHVFERLVGLGEHMELVPVLAERWETSPDLKTYTFYLRKGKLFHNGREMVAEDVKYSIERVMDPKTGNIRRKEFKNVSSIKVLDKYTVRFHMKEADSQLLSALGAHSPIMAIVPREEVEKQGGKMGHPVGTGPYKFVEWKPDRYLILERFDQYKPQPGPMNGLGGERIAHFDKLKFVPIPEESVAVMALLNKEIDVLLSIPVVSIEKFETDYKKLGIVLEEKPGLAIYGIWFGCDHPVTKDIKFRRACAYAIDRDLVTNAAMRGHATVNSSFVATENQYYSDRHREWFKRDLEKAKMLLKESSYQGEEIPFITNKKYEMMYDQSVVIQSQLAEIGIKTKLVVLDVPTTIKHLVSGDFQILSWGSSPRIDPAQAAVDFGFSHIGKEYPRVGEIFKEANRTMDFEIRKKLFEELYGLVQETVPMYYCYHPNTRRAYWNYVKGFKAFALGQPRFWNVWFDKH